MVEFLTVVLVLVGVVFAIYFFYFLLKFEFRQLVFRPFLKNQPHQPNLIDPRFFQHLCHWPPKCPDVFLAKAPENPEEKAAWSRQWRIYGGCHFMFWSLVIMMSLAAGNFLSSSEPNFFVVISYCAQGFILIVPWAAGLTDTLTAIVFAAAKCSKKPLPNQRKNWEMERWSLLATLLIIFWLIACNTGYQWGRDSPATKTVEVPLERLPQCLDKLKVFLITDVHTGIAVGKSFVEETVKVANSLSPDVVLHVGDGGDGRPIQIGDYNKPWGDITCPNRYFVTGNHEYLHGNDGPKAWEDFYRDEVGFTVLHNTAVKVGATEFPSRSCSAGDSLTLVGIPDAQQADSSLPEAIKTVDSVNDEWILMSHQPRVFPEAVTKNVGLQVSGHIHAGQCFPLHPIIYLTSRGLFSGLIQREKSFLFVSNGNANWGFRTRLFSSPHNTLLILRHAQTFAAEGKKAELASTTETKWAIAGLVMAPLWLLGSLAVYIIESYFPASAWWCCELATHPEKRPAELEMVPTHQHEALSTDDKDADL